MISDVNSWGSEACDKLLASQSQENYHAGIYASYIAYLLYKHETYSPFEVTEENTYYRASRAELPLIPAAGRNLITLQRVNPNNGIILPNSRTVIGGFYGNDQTDARICNPWFREEQLRLVLDHIDDLTSNQMVPKQLTRR